MRETRGDSLQDSLQQMIDQKKKKQNKTKTSKKQQKEHGKFMIMFLDITYDANTRYPNVENYFEKT